MTERQVDSDLRSRRYADDLGARDVKRVEKHRQILIVSVRRVPNGRSARTTAIVTNDMIVLAEARHLLVPLTRVQPSAMNEDDRGPGSSLFVIELGAVGGH